MDDQGTQGDQETHVGDTRAPEPQHEDGHQDVHMARARPARAAGPNFDASDVEVDMDQEAFEDELAVEDDQDHGGEGEPVPAHFRERSDGWNLALCPRCLAATESTYHQLWECPKNEGITGAKLHLLPRAQAEWREAPSYWLRGLPPIQWVERFCEAPPSSRIVLSRGSSDEPVALDAGMTIATDGSGGAFSSDPRLRRCGWGFMVLDGAGQEVCPGRGPLLGWRQTVPLAELAAVRALLHVTTGPIQVYIDSKVVVKGIHRGASWRHTRNAYQWEDVWKK